VTNSSDANEETHSQRGVFCGSISSDAFAKGEEAEGWTHAGRSIGFPVTRYAPPNGERLIAKGVVRTLPGLALISASATPFEITWDKTITDDVFVCFSDGCGMANRVSQGSEVIVQGAGALVVDPETAASTAYRGGVATGLRAPRRALSMIPNDLLFKRQALPAGSALDLLKIYLAVLNDPHAIATARQREMTVNHVHDLLALAIGLTGCEREAALQRGGAAARLYALKKDIDRFLFSPRLGAVFLARRNGITPRHVHRLFEAEGVSLSQYVLERRLLEGYRLLAESEACVRTVTDIAFSVGFNDLSYFNRAFARRFSAQPREVRRLFHGYRR